MVIGFYKKYLRKFQWYIILKNNMSVSKKYILAIDQGTSATKAIIFNENGELVTKATAPLKSYFPEIGFVEQNPQEIYQSVIDATKACIQQFEALKPNENRLSGV